MSAQQRIFEVSGDRARLERLARRLLLATVLVLVAFAAYYGYDRYFVRAESPAQQGLRKLEDAVRQKPNDPDARLNVAAAYAQQRQYDKAIEQFQEALRLKKDWQVALLGLANAQLKGGDQQSAEKTYRRLADLNQNNPLKYSNTRLQTVYYQLGVFASKAGRHDEAANWAREALKINRTESDALFLLAGSLEAQGDRTGAREAYRQATTFDPGFREALSGLARTAGALGDAREAGYAQGMERLAAGDLESALSKLQQLVVDAPDYAEAHVGLGLVYYRKGQRDEARVELQAALDRKPNLLLAQWTLNSLEPGR